MFIHSHLIDFQITHLVMHRTHGLYWNHRVRWGVVVISAEVWWKFWVSTRLPLRSHSKEWKGYLLTVRWRWKSIIWTWSPLTLRVRFYASWWGWKSWPHTCFLRHHPAEGAPTCPCWPGWGVRPQPFLRCFAWVEWPLSTSFVLLVSPSLVLRLERAGFAVFLFLVCVHWHFQVTCIFSSNRGIYERERKPRDSLSYWSKNFCLVKKH